MAGSEFHEVREVAGSKTVTLRDVLASVREVIAASGYGSDDLEITDDELKTMRDVVDRKVLPEVAEYLRIRDEGDRQGQHAEARVASGD